MTFIKYLFPILLFIFCNIHNSYGQTKKEKLQQEQKKLKEELEELRSMIEEKENTKKMSLAQLKTLTKKIEKRELLINNINNQLLNLEEDILSKIKDIDDYKLELKTLKEDYAKIITATYKKRATYNDLLFVFSSSSFNQALARFKYIRNYSSYRNEQATKITRSIELMKEKVNALNLIKDKKEMLLEDNKKESQNLLKEKSQKDNFVKELKSDIANLSKEHKQKVQAEKQLASQIQKIIQEEIRKRKEQKAKEQKKDPHKIDNESLNTPEELALQKDFTSNKGKLPWPVSKGYIVEHFGRQSHPLDPDLIIEKNGIGIKTEKGSEIRSLFKGKVINIFNVPGFQQSVMIEHGNYITVYSHLSLVYVKVGESVNTKEPIGKVFTDEQSGDAVTELQIWNGTIKMDPESWIAPK